MTARMRLAGPVSLFIVLMAAPAFGQGVTLPAFERVELDNGAVLLLTEKRDVPLVSVSAVLRGGAITDPEGRNGLASLFAALLEKGSGDRDAARFAEAVESVGGRLTISADLENTTISAEFLARDADLMIGLVGDMLLRPSLAADELQKLRERSIEFIRAAKDTNLNALLPIYGHAFLFGDHPYGNPVSGSETSLDKISHADALDYYARHFGADRLVISVAGDIDTQVIAAKLAESFSDWRKAGAAPVDVPAPLPQTGRRVLLIDKPGATQTYFWIGNVGVSRHYENRAALDIANTVFGGRYTSMLNAALRQKSGLTYGARSVLTRFARPGSFAILSYTRSDATTEAIDMAIALLGRLRDGDEPFVVSDDMLASAKNYILGQFPTAFETAAQIGAQLAALEAFGLDASYINDYGSDIMAADASGIHAVIDAVYPAAENLVFVLLGDAELIRDAAGQYGPLTEMAISEPRFRP